MIDFTLNWMSISLKTKHTDFFIKNNSLYLSSYSGINEQYYNHSGSHSSQRGQSAWVRMVRL